MNTHTELENSINAVLSQNVRDISSGVETLPPCILGTFGIGKSALVNKIIADRKLYPIDIRLSQIDAVELNGYPYRTTDAEGRSRMDYAAPKLMPLVGDKIPEGYEGFALKFDEITSASEEVLAACYKVILERLIGSYKLHPSCLIICAGNLESDNSITIPLPPTLQTRMVTFSYELSALDWLLWGHSAGISSGVLQAVTAINTVCDYQEVVAEGKTQHSYMTPRTLAFLSRLLKESPKDYSKNSSILIKGILGESAAKKLTKSLKTSAETTKEHLKQIKIVLAQYEALMSSFPPLADIENFIDQPKNIRTISALSPGYILELIKDPLTITLGATQIRRLAEVIQDTLEMSKNAEVMTNTRETLEECLAILNTEYGSKKESPTGLGYTRAY